MRDINEPCGDNLGGLLSFDFIPSSDVLSIPEPNKSRILQPIVLKSGKSWSSGYGTRGTMSFSEDQGNGDHGAKYAAKISLVVPKEESENEDLYHEMRHQTFIVVYTNANGLKKVVGTIAEPLKFTSNLSTGSDVPNRNQHTIQFYEDTTRKALTYDI